MSYRDRQKLHPEWPRLVREWECRLVRLPRPFKTKGGDEFDEGTILLVTSAYRGYLSLCDNRKDGPRRLIRMVRPEDVELLPMGTP